MSLNGPQRPFHPLVGVTIVVLALAFLLALPRAGVAQDAMPPLEDLLHVMPGADRFEGPDGTPPVIRGFRVDPETGAETLLGYLFLTSDLPPEVKGYDAPIEVLVGMDLTGTLTGVRVMRYWESLYRTRGHFFGTRGFQEQFTGKHISDPFRIRRDLDGISGATISVDAMARSVRDSARRVASAYLSGPGAGAGGGVDRGAPVTLETLAERSWLELVDRGPVDRLMVVRSDVMLLEIFVLHLWEEGAGEILLGAEPFAQALDRAGERAGTDHLLLLGLDGSLIWFRPHLLGLVQDGDTLSASSDDLILFEPPRGGKVGDQLRSAGIWMVDGRFDMTRPFTLHFGGALGMDVATLEVPGRAPPAARVAEAPAPAPPPAPEGAPREAADPAPAAAPEPGGAVAPGTAGVAPTAGDPAREADPPGPPEAPEVREATGAAPGGAGAPGEAAAVEGDRPDAPAGEALDFSFLDDEVEESQWARTLARTSWGRVGRFALLLVLVTAAFLTRLPALRWAALGGTLLLLGFVDHGFLSISHVTSALTVGPGVFLGDVALLMMVVFTVVTTLLWGRVFCGYLCPFGALQDLLERVVPRRFRRELSPRAHHLALRAKYGVLALIVVPAALGFQLYIFQYFEPFGTVFFFSASAVLWTIALAFLAAAAVVPRFYCRYACPLGAALAVGSRLSPFRIRRVEQCQVCTVCERACPTGAIRKEVVDFPECVRCGICEVKLRERAGTCRHPMEEIRPRLVQLRIPAGREG
jgi:ferredoxin